MQIKTKAIVISTLKFQEKSLLVTCYTASDGIKKYIVHTVFSSKKSNQKIAYFQPLTILDVEAIHKNKGTFEYFKEIRLAQPYHSIPNSILKSTIVIFLSEILYNSVKEEEQNVTLFSFLETALLWLDTHELNANFHIIFMLELTKFFGFYPDENTINFTFFDKREGCFVPYQTTDASNEVESALLKKIIGLKWDVTSNNLTSKERYSILNLLLDYYTYHLEGFKKPKSLEVLKEVFS
jgi:DNA repair protein RecO (recombination protein O)